MNRESITFNQILKLIFYFKYTIIFVNLISILLIIFYLNNSKLYKSIYIVEPNLIKMNMEEFDIYECDISQNFRISNYIDEFSLSFLANKKHNYFKNSPCVFSSKKIVLSNPKSAARAHDYFDKIKAEFDIEDSDLTDTSFINIDQFKIFNLELLKNSNFFTFGEDVKYMEINFKHKFSQETDSIVKVYMNYLNRNIINENINLSDSVSKKISYENLIKKYDNFIKNNNTAIQTIKNKLIEILKKNEKSINLTDMMQNLQVGKNYNMLFIINAFLNLDDINKKQVIKNIENLKINDEENENFKLMLKNIVQMHNESLQDVANINLEILNHEFYSLKKEGTFRITSFYYLIVVGLSLINLFIIFFIYFYLLLRINENK